MRQKTRRRRPVRTYRSYGGRRPGVRWLRLAAVLFGIAVVCFGVLEGLVLAGGRTEIAAGPGEPEVMVIFGCKAESWGPSVLLQDRLDTALDYLKDHPDITIVVSGGKGNDEHISEAQCMYDYLTAHGVDGTRIIRENQSRNTCQNIRNTLTLLQSGDIQPATGNFLLVSSDFHLTRIKMLWGRVWPGTYTLSTLAAPCSHLPSRIHMFFREPLALVKSFLFDR